MSVNDRAVPVRRWLEPRDRDPPNSRLFRYFSLQSPERESWTRDIFVKNELYFASPTSFNDPFDGKVPPLDALPERERRRFVEEFVRKRISPAPRNERRLIKRELSTKEAFALTAQHFQKTVDTTGLLCLSERNDDILMWSHYADGHKGICVEFEASSNTPLFSEAFPVEYADTYTAFPLLGGGREWVNRVLLTKSNHWKYEREWRVTRHPYVVAGVATVTPSARRNPFSPGSLLGVIFGCQCPPDIVKKVNSWIVDGGCQVTRYQARRKRKEYGLEIEKLS